MSEEWRPVAVGFAIASLGAGATALYIVGVSWLYVGRFSSGGLALVGASLGAIAFRRSLGPYLDALDARAEAGPVGGGPEDRGDGLPGGDGQLRP
jgi:hypothetical protein